LFFSLTSDELPAVETQPALYESVIVAILAAPVSFPPGVSGIIKQ